METPKRRFVLNALLATMLAGSATVATVVVAGTVPGTAAETVANRTDDDGACNSDWD